jgi:hypothetical protein
LFSVCRFFQFSSLRKNMKRPCSIAYPRSTEAAPAGGDQAKLQNGFTDSYCLQQWSGDKSVHFQSPCSYGHHAVYISAISSHNGRIAIQSACVDRTDFRNRNPQPRTPASRIICWSSTSGCALCPSLLAVENKCLIGYRGKDRAILTESGQGQISRHITAP